MTEPEQAIARPFVKCAGGKSKQASRIADAIQKPFGGKKFYRYFELFVGGGAVFFELAKRKAFTTAVLSDTNAELISAYRVIRDNPYALIAELRVHEFKYKKDPEGYFYHVRDASSLHEGTLVQFAARFIFLNKTCYNGLYRVNKSGEFNVPFGRYKNPTICDEVNIHACSAVLQKVRIDVCDFRHARIKAFARGAAVYFDPPYLPLVTEGNKSFTSYQKEGFTFDDQANLAALAALIERQGVHVVLSNADAPEAAKLYPSKLWKRTKVQAARNINSDGQGRAAVSELLITPRVTK